MPGSGPGCLRGLWCLFCPRTSSPVLSTAQGCIICSLSKLRNESELVSEGAVGGVRLILILKKRKKKKKKTQQNGACRTTLLSVWIVVLDKKGDALLGKDGISRTLYTRLTPKSGLCSWPCYRFLMWLWAKQFCFIHLISSRMRSLVQSCSESHRRAGGGGIWGGPELWLCSGNSPGHRAMALNQGMGIFTSAGWNTSRLSELCCWVVPCSIFTSNIRLQSKDTDCRICDLK